MEQGSKDAMLVEGTKGLNYTSARNLLSESNAL
jgi:hypothetical protein